jgi:oxygen-independent coproporphyrinogen III oxidase
MRSDSDRPGPYSGMISPQDLAGNAGAARRCPPAADLDLDLIRKYSAPVPRYTSYPPATQFHANLESLRLDEALAADNAPGAGPVSLYLHLPFCESLCWFCGCNTVITRRHDAADSYLEDLAREFDLTLARLDRRRPVTQLHLGGGTPTFLQPEQLRRLGSLLRERFVFTPDAEVSAELDPRRLTSDHVAALREMGVNRISLGVQDTNPAVQKAINRIQPQEMNVQVVAWLRAAGITSINIDLIYGLPLQTPESFDRTIDDTLDLGPDRLSVFSYAHVPWMKPSQKIFEQRAQLPSPEAKLAMFALAHGRLTQAGFVDIGLDHFARPDDELAVAQRTGTLHRNFQGYTTRAGASLYGFGVSSISQTVDTYRQNHKTLLTWRDELHAGRLPVERGLRLTTEDLRRRTLVMSIMCRRGLDYRALSEELGIDVARTYAAEIASLSDLEADGLLERDSAGIRLTPKGVPLLRVVAVRFDATFQSAHRRHAQAV